MNQLIGAIGLFTASHALFMGAMLCISKSRIPYTNQILACLSLVLAIYFSTFFIANYWPHLDSNIYLVANVQLLLGPLLYLYLVTSLNQHKSTGIIELAHFVPALIFALLCSWVFGEANRGGAIYTNPLPVKLEVAIYGICCSIHLLIYCIACHVQLRKAIGATAGQVGSIGIKWYQKIIAIFVVLGLSRGLADILILYFDINAGVRQLAVMLPGLLFLYFIGIATVSNKRHSLVGSIAEGSGVLLPSLEKHDLDQRTAYSHSGLSQAIAEKILKQLEDSVLGQKQYLVNDLKLADLSRELNIPQENISEALNVYGDTNFYDYLAKYRTEHAMQILENTVLNSVPLIDVAMDSGFNSQSTFNRQFKMRVGVTPSAYRKNH